MFDCLRDMGGPAGAARARVARGRRDVDDRRAGRARPRRGQAQPGRARLLLLLDAALHAGVASQEVGLALGAQAGEARIRDVVTAGGFTRFRRAAESPFNLVFEGRP
jgi:hypothetical protein